ncbi:MAG: carbohydrate-binding domain-containing protein [Bacteroidaceae bacterium]|nr:carbohydrate-binding domain-containing protein [Bacteroidaceae bacterium]
MKPKRFLQLLMAFFLAMITIAAPLSVGDLDGDGKITVSDITQLIGIYLGDSATAGYDLSQVDMDGDSTVTVADITLLIEAYLADTVQTDTIVPDTIVPDTIVPDTVVFNDTIYVTYNDTAATVSSLPDDGSIVASISGADVLLTSMVTDREIYCILSGSSDAGSFVWNGSYKMTVRLNGLTLTGSSEEAINIKCGKRIALELADGTVNTLSDAKTDGGQKGAFYTKGHLEISGGGTLNLNGNIKHGISSKEYMLIKKTVGVINVVSAAKDGIHAGQYFKMNGGEVTVSSQGDDAIQAEATADATDEDNGQLIVKGGTLNLSVTADGADALKCDFAMTISDGTMTINTTGAANKGLKADGNINISGGTINITQTGGKIVGTDISYSTGIKTDANINITGGSVTIVNSADGGKGISADGDISINDTTATVTLDITANGAGGTAELSEDTTTTVEPEDTKSYVVYVALPTSTGGGGRPGQQSNYWTTLYLYKSDGTLVQQLTSTVTKTSGSTTKTFYYYDFKDADSGTYYFKSADYTSQPRPGSSGTTYAIQSATFTGPTSGEDYYYEISSSRTTSGNTYTFKITNVTNTWNGSTTDVSEDSGVSYNASGIKADGNLTISGGTITVRNSGAMSKSIKSKATVTIDGGNITLSPSGAMQVINSDASYSSGIKTVDFVQNDATLTITSTGAAGRGISATNITTNGGTLNVTNSGNGQSGTNDSYTAKGLKADTKIALNAGTVTIKMTGTGGKGIKSSGTYTQGTTDGNGPVLTVTTTGSSFGSTGNTGGWGGPGQESGGSSAKAIKVQGKITLYGGETVVNTSTNGAEGLESKEKSANAISIEGGKHYFKCYDDCINSAGCILFNGGVTVCYGTGNDAVDSNYGASGAITIGNGTVFAYTTNGAPEEGLDCDNNSYIKITGTGNAFSAGASQGGGGGWGGSSSGIGSATQGYYLYSSNSGISFATNRYYTLADASGNNMFTFSFEGSCSSTLSLITAKGMTSGSSYTIKYSTTKPTDATTEWHGIYLGSSHVGNNSVLSFTATK